jgi:hypothetical protein
VHRTPLSRLPAHAALVSAFLASAVLACGDEVVVPSEDVPASLAIVVAPTATVLTGALIVPQPVVELRNAEGEAIRRAGVTVAVSASAGTLRGTTSVPTDAEGRATFAGLSLTGQEGPSDLQFSCCDLPPVTRTVSLSFGENPLAPASATIVEGEAGSEMIPGPAVRINTWALGDGAVVRFTLEGPGSLPQETVIANAQGVAQLPSFRFGDTPETSILTATIEGTEHRVRFQLTSALSGIATIRDEAFTYSGKAGESFTLPSIEVTNGFGPVPGVAVRIRTFTALAAPIVRVTDAAGRIDGVSVPLSTIPMENVFDVFAVGYMPAPVTLSVLGVEHPPVRLVTDAPANVMPLEDAYGRTFVFAWLIDALGAPIMDSPLRLTAEGEVGTVSWWDMFGPAAGPSYPTDEFGSVGVYWRVPAAPGTYRVKVSSPYVPAPLTFTAVRE